jgi:hypothetical protein
MQWLGAAVDALKNQLLRQLALVIKDVPCAWGSLNRKNHHLVGCLLDAFCDN